MNGLSCSVADHPPARGWTCSELRDRGLIEVKFCPPPPLGKNGVGSYELAPLEKPSTSRHWSTSLILFTNPCAAVASVRPVASGLKPRSKEGIWFSKAYIWLEALFVGTVGPVVAFSKVPVPL